MIERTYPHGSGREEVPVWWRKRMSRPTTAMVTCRSGTCWPPGRCSGTGTNSAGSPPTRRPRRTSGPVVKKTSNDVRVRRWRITPGVAAGAGDRHPGPRLVALARPPAGQPPVHWAARLGTDVRLQHDAQLGEQHHPVPTLEHLHRVQQRRERPGRAVRGRVTTPNVGRQPSLHAGRLTEVRSAHVGGQQVDSVLGNEGGALPHVEGQ